MRKLIKGLVPPFVLQGVKNAVRRPIIYKPVWNTFSYSPMNGVKMYFDPKGPWQRKVLSDGYDSYIFDKLKSLNLTGKTIYDVGAHIGFHSFYFARLVGSQGKVYAFEPHPKNLERISLQLKENSDLKKIVSVYDFAISDKKGEEEFTLNNDIESGRSSGGFIKSADTIWEKSAFTNRGFIETKVKTIPLDSLQEIGVDQKPDILKIDVEGAEASVLRGAQKIILEHKPLILLEVHSMRAMFDVMSFFNSVSYNASIIHEEIDGRCFIEARSRK